MLSQSFLEWWFEPWHYAAASKGRTAPAVDAFARRDAYRLWCLGACVAPDLPQQFDAGWCVTANREAASVLGAARLLGGLIAARNRDLDSLKLLALADRKWCLSIAATQPLQSLSGRLVQGKQSMQLCGLLEIAIHLERGFPGLWSRLRLMLPGTLAQEVAALLGTAGAHRAGAKSANTRIQRCWRMCLTRASAIG